MSAPVAMRGGGGSGGGGAVPAASALGLVAQTVPPTNASSDFTLAAGTLVFVLASFPAASISTLGAWVTVAGVTATGVNGLALYTEAGVLVDQTVDMSADFAVTGWRAGALAGGARNVAAGSYYLAALMHYTTAGKLAGVSAVANIPAIRGHYSSVFLGAQASFPASFSPAAANLNSGGYYLAAY